MPLHTYITTSKKTSSTRVHFLLTLLVLMLTSGCSYLPQKHNGFSSSEQAKHPAAVTFIAYTNAVKHGAMQTDLIKFYPPKDRKRISKLIGWSRFVYTSPYKALKNGTCKSITLKIINPNRSQLDCLGSYEYKRLFSNTATSEPMHLRVYLTKNNHEWYMGQSGLQHTQGSDPRLTIVKFGLKFVHQLNTQE